MTTTTQPPTATTANARTWNHHHVLDLDDFSRDEIEEVLDPRRAHARGARPPHRARARRSVATPS